MPATEEINEVATPSEQIKWVVPQLLKPHPINEKIYGKEAVDPGLVASIKEGGIIEELQVTPEHVIISGHRRRAAAIEAGLESVPVRVRFDLDTDDKVVWALIEANRTQRDKTFEQKIREIMEVNDRLKAFRSEVANRYGVTKLDEIAEMEELDPKAVRTENAKELQTFIKENNPTGNTANESLLVALKHYGISKLHYSKARKAMIAIESFEADGKMSEAKEIRKALNTKGLKAFDKVVNRLKGTPAVKKPTKPEVLAKKAIASFEEAASHLPKDSDSDRRVQIALGIMTAVKEELQQLNTAPQPQTESIQDEDQASSRE